MNICFLSICTGGLGLGMIYLPSIIIIGYYFEKYRALSTGIAVCGSSIGALCLSPLFTYILRNYGWERCFQLQSILLASLMIFIVFFKSLEPIPVLLEEIDDLLPGDKDSV